jgi:hypothetical protein
MITPEKIEEWLKEAEERPGSAGLLIRYIANRLSELSARNEELLADNIALRLGHKVEEYESRIANLEYQLELLKRQLASNTGGEPADAGPGGRLPAQPPARAGLALLLYTPQGQVLKAEVDEALTPGPSPRVEEGKAGAPVARLSGMLDAQAPPGLLLVRAHEELLLIFDSGRTVALPAAGLTANPAQALDWSQASLYEPRGVEALVAIAPISRMALADFAIQASRRGCLKKLPESFFESCVAKDFIGTGVKLPADQTFGLTLCGKDDQVVLVSQAGFVAGAAVERLPFTIEEALRLASNDHLVTAFALAGREALLFVTHNGKAVQRAASWLEPAVSAKSQGQALLSPSRRAAGVRIVGAAAAAPEDWGLALLSDGTLTAHRLGDLLDRGALLPPDSPLEVLAFAAAS